MIPYYSTRYAASATGTSIAGVECDQCGCQYFYELTRTGSGSVSTPYGLGAGSATQSAQEQSAGELAERLGDEAEIVPCPQCHWINEELVTGYRRSRLRWVLPLAVGIGGFGTVACLIAAAYVWYGPEADRFALPWILIGGPLISVSTGVLLVLLRNGLRRLIRPNRHFPARPRVPPGSPPALLLDESTETLRPVTPADAAESERGESRWYDFQFGRHSLPACCSGCLGEPNEKSAWAHPVTTAVELKVPLCATCRRSSKGVCLKAWLASFTVCVGVGATIIWTVAEDDLVRTIFTVTLVLLSLGFAAWFASMKSAPVDVKVVDQSRGILRLRFGHPDYRPNSTFDEQQA